MADSIDIKLIDYASEPDIAVLGGPLWLGYLEYIAGRPEHARSIIAEFLADVYSHPSRAEERIMEWRVIALYCRRHLSVPVERKNAARDILVEAAGFQYDCVHLPMLRSILSRGYQLHEGEPITMTEKQGRYLVWDGKNRCSVLAAMGWHAVPHVVML
jgi:hypothetical protein